MQSELLKIEELNITEHDEAHIFYLSGEYGPELSDQVVQTLLVAAEVGRLSYAFEVLEKHFIEHIDCLPFHRRGLIKTSPRVVAGKEIAGANPSQMVLHRLKEELAPASNLSAA